jgi:hypothetical protein
MWLASLLLCVPLVAGVTGNACFLAVAGVPVVRGWLSLLVLFYLVAGAPGVACFPAVAGVPVVRG